MAMGPSKRQSLRVRDSRMDSMERRLKFAHKKLALLQRKVESGAGSLQERVVLTQRLEKLEKRERKLAEFFFDKLFEVARGKQANRLNKPRSYYAFITSIDGPPFNDEGMDVDMLDVGEEAQGAEEEAERGATWHVRVECVSARWMERVFRELCQAPDVAQVLLKLDGDGDPRKYDKLPEEDRALLFEAWQEFLGQMRAPGAPAPVALIGFDVALEADLRKWWHVGDWFLITTVPEDASHVAVPAVQTTWLTGRFEKRRTTSVGILAFTRVPDFREDKGIPQGALKALHFPHSNPGAPRQADDPSPSQPMLIEEEQAPADEGIDIEDEAFMRTWGRTWRRWADAFRSWFDDFIEDLMPVPAYAGVPSGMRLRMPRGRELAYAYTGSPQDAGAPIPNPMVNNGGAHQPFVGVLDVGQGNCNPLYDDQGRIFTYFDFGAPESTWHKSWPDTDTQPCFCHNPLIILSHWDGDHHLLAPRYEESYKYRWLAHRTHNGVIAAVIKSGIKKAHGELWVWSEGAGSHMRFPWGFLERCKGDLKKEANNCGITAYICVRDDPANPAAPPLAVAGPVTADRPGVQRAIQNPAQVAYHTAARRYAGDARLAGITAVAAALSSLSSRIRKLLNNDQLAEVAKVAVDKAATSCPQQDVEDEIEALASIQAIDVGDRPAVLVPAAQAACEVVLPTSAGTELTVAANAMGAAPEAVEAAPRVFRDIYDVSPLPAPYTDQERFVLTTGDGNFLKVPHQHQADHPRPPVVVGLVAAHHGSDLVDNGRLSRDHIPWAPGTETTVQFARATGAAALAKAHSSVAAALAPVILLSSEHNADEDGKSFDWTQPVGTYEAAAAQAAQLLLGDPTLDADTLAADPLLAAGGDDQAEHIALEALKVVSETRRLAHAAAAVAGALEAKLSDGTGAEKKDLRDYSLQWATAAAAACVAAARAAANKETAAAAAGCAIRSLKKDSKIAPTPGRLLDRDACAADAAEAAIAAVTASAPYGVTETRDLAEGAVSNEEDPLFLADVVCKAVSAGLKAVHSGSNVLDAALKANKLSAAPTKALRLITRAATAAVASAPGGEALAALGAMGLPTDGSASFDQTDVTAAALAAPGRPTTGTMMEQAARAAAEAAAALICEVESMLVVNAVAAAVCDDERARHVAALPAAARIAYPYGVEPDGRHGYKSHPVERAISMYISRGWTERRNTSKRADLDSTGAKTTGGEDETCHIDSVSPMGHVALGWTAADAPLAVGQVTRTCPTCAHPLDFNC
jgi:hypothetical protein